MNRREVYNSFSDATKEITLQVSKTRAIAMEAFGKLEKQTEESEKLRKALTILKMHSMDVSKVCQCDYLKYARHCNYNTEQVPSEEDYNFVKSVLEE